MVAQHGKPQEKQNAFHRKAREERNGQFST
jgi:hypothetical protein